MCQRVIIPQQHRAFRHEYFRLPGLPLFSCEEGSLVQGNQAPWCLFIPHLRESNACCVLGCLADTGLLDCCTQTPPWLRPALRAACGQFVKGQDNFVFCSPHPFPPLHCLTLSFHPPHTSVRHLDTPSILAVNWQGFAEQISGLNSLEAKVSKLVITQPSL